MAVVDRLPFGGTCSLRGCVPKKVLFSGAEAVAHARMLAGKGVSGSCSLDWPALMAFKRTYTEPTPERMESWMHDLGIETLHGTATFISADGLTIDGEGATAAAIVIATGAKPAPLGIPGEEHITTSTGFLELEEMPQRVVFIGGGYVSFELAAIARHAGAEATILHRSSEVLGGFDRSLVQKLVARYRSLGIEVLTDSPVRRVRRSRKSFAVEAPQQRIEADLVVHGAGRVPDLAALNPEAGGVAVGPGGVRVDRHLCSISNPRVWALGDAAEAGMPLTPVAGAQGEVVAASILGGRVEYCDADTPSVVFSDPPLTRVGLEAEAAVPGSGLERRDFDMGSWLSQTRVGNDTAGAVLVVDVATDTIRGAHILGVGAEELVNLFTLAIKFGLTLAELRTVTWTYPTFAYEINYLTGRY